MSTSQGTYGRIEQTLYVIRDTYETCGGLGGGAGIGNRCPNPTLKPTPHTKRLAFLDFQK